MDGVTLSEMCTAKKQLLVSRFSMKFAVSTETMLEPFSIRQLATSSPTTSALQSRNNLSLMSRNVGVVRVLLGQVFYFNEK